MDFLTYIPPKFVVPILLLFIKLGFKQLIDRQATYYNVVKGFLDLPMDILFITLSLMSAVLIMNGWSNPDIFVGFIVIILFLLISTLLWKRSIENYDKENWWTTFFQALVNFLISVPILVYTIQVLAKKIR